MGIKVFFNDSCSVCRLEINHYKKISDNNLEWIDITNNDDALKILIFLSLFIFSNTLTIIASLGFVKKNFLFLSINFQ